MRPQPWSTAERSATTPPELRAPCCAPLHDAWDSPRHLVHAFLQRFEGAFVEGNVYRGPVAAFLLEEADADGVVEAAGAGAGGLKSRMPPTSSLWEVAVSARLVTPSSQGRLLGTARLFDEVEIVGACRFPQSCDPFRKMDI